MAFDLAVFDKSLYVATTEYVDQQTNLFNAASGGAITLVSAQDNQGDFAMEASFRAISGLVRRRKVYNGTDAVTATRLTQLQNNSVKVAAGTPPIEFERAQYEWIKQNPEQAGLIIGQQLAEATIQDMLNTAILGAVAAISGVPDLTYSTTSTPTFVDLVQGAGKFGDRQGQIAAWIMHSKSMTDLYAKAVSNNEHLFTYGTVNIMRDPFGRLLIMSDSDALVETSGSDTSYKILGLVPGGVMVEQNDDFDANMQRENGKENIQSSYQAEWSYNLGLLGYSWSIANGGKAPSNAAIASATSWEKTATSNKDTAGVLIAAA